MSLAAFLQRIVAVLKETGTPFMLTGSLAGAYYGQARATQDVDLVVELQPEQLQRLVQLLTDEGFYASAIAAEEALRLQGQFNVIDPESGWKADLIVRKAREFSLSEFNRRRSATILGIEVALTSVEDLIIAKLEWSQLGSSDLQREDVQAIVDGSADSLDFEYLSHWIDRLGLQSAWQNIRKSST